MKLETDIDFEVFMDLVDTIAKEFLDKEFYEVYEELSEEGEPASAIEKERDTVYKALGEALVTMHISKLLVQFVNKHK